MLGRYDRALRARQPVGGQTLLARAIAAIRRNNGALFYVPANFAGSWTDSAGTDPVNKVSDVISLMTDRTGGSAVATQDALIGDRRKPTVQRPAANNVIRFDSSNDSLSVNLASGGSPFVRSHTRTGTVSGFTSATTSAFVLGQPTVAGRDVCAIVCAPSAITGADLTAIERWAASIGATL